MNSLPVAKSCHKMGCELSAHCALYKAEKAQMQIIPEFCGYRCDDFKRKPSPEGDDIQERLMRMAGCLQ